MIAHNRTWSLRRRLTGRVLLLVMGGWLATILLSVAVLNHEMTEMFDEELAALVETTVLFLDAAPGNDSPRMLGVETNDGERVLRIVPFDRAVAPAPWPAFSRDGFHDAPGWRILRRSAEGVVIEAAYSKTWQREETLEAASALLVLALPLVGLLLLGLRRTVAEATQPVSRLAADVAVRGPDDLSPVNGGALPEEVQPLAAALNGYLTRIEALRHSERDFIANAAHELRTPLATLRNQLCLSADPDAVAAVTTVDSLARRVERLLQLSQLEAGVGIGRGPSDLIRILRLLIEEVRPRARHAIVLDDGDMESLSVGVDPDALAILLRNILENAVEHGTGEVRVKVAPGGILSIQNPTEHEIIPERRFERGNMSTGLGLGLSIVSALASEMGVTLTRKTAHKSISVELVFVATGEKQD